MSFAKLPTQAPQFDAGALQTLLANLAVKNGLKIPAGFVSWKRWVEATSEQDGVGLRDVVNANALGLNAVKKDVDNLAVVTVNQEARIAALEAAPKNPFPASG